MDDTQGPVEPSHPPGTISHKMRVKRVSEMIPEGKTGGVCIDNTPEHIAFYVHELKKYPRLIVEYQGEVTKDVYLIRVRQGPSLN